MHDMHVYSYNHFLNFKLYTVGYFTILIDCLLCMWHSKFKGCLQFQSKCSWEELVRTLWLQTLHLKTAYIQIQKWYPNKEDWFLRRFFLTRWEVVQPVPTNTVLQPAKVAAMCTRSRAETCPPSLSHLLLSHLPYPTSSYPTSPYHTSSNPTFIC